MQQGNEFKLCSLLVNHCIVPICRERIENTLWHDTWPLQINIHKLQAKGRNKKQTKKKVIAALIPVVRKYLANDGISIITRKQNNKQHKIPNSKAVSPEFPSKSAPSPHPPTPQKTDFKQLLWMNSPLCFYRLMTWWLLWFQCDVKPNQHSVDIDPLSHTNRNTVQLMGQVLTDSDQNLRLK